MEGCPAACGRCEGRCVCDLGDRPGYSHIIVTAVVLSRNEFPEGQRAACRAPRPGGQGLVGIGPPCPKSRALCWTWDGLAAKQDPMDVRVRAHSGGHHPAFQSSFAAQFIGCWREPWERGRVRVLTPVAGQTLRPSRESAGCSQSHCAAALPRGLVGSQWPWAGASCVGRGRWHPAKSRELPGSLH